MAQETRTQGRSIVSVDWLRQHIDDPDVVVLCASMGNPIRSHQVAIPGAIVADLESDFSDASNSLPHTAPQNATAVFENVGVSDSSTVVVYDRHGMMCAARVWWLARLAGLSSVAVLDGGLPAWIAAGGETSASVQAQSRGRITASENRHLLTDMRGVERAAARSYGVIVDARSAGRFAGVDPEPRDGLVAGHIPGSVNLPYTDVVDDNGLLKTPEELQTLVENVVGSARELTMTCGSGVSACLIALAAWEAGYRDVVVYDGSWSEWGRPDLGKPYET